MRRWTLAVATLVSLLAFASPALASTVTIQSAGNATPSAASGARTVYRVTFTTSATGALPNSGTVQITLPAGTTAPEWQGGTLRDVTRNVDVGSCANPVSTTVSNCTMFSGGFVNAGDQLTVTLRGLTNGSVGTNKTIQVRTSADVDTATSAQFAVVAGGSVSQPNVTISSPSAAAGARTRYVIGFTVSGTGGLSAEAGSQITVNLPGTTTPGWQSGTLRDITRNVDVGSCSEPDANQISTCGFFSNGFVNPGDQLQITLRGITNGTAGTKTASVTTTSDLPTITSSNYTVVAGNSITTPTVAISDPSAATGARTRYVIGFSVSGTGGLSAEAGSQITVNLPGTTTPGWQSGTLRDITRNVDVGSCSEPDANQISTCGFFSNGFVNPGDQLQITLRGITNGTAGTKTASVTTTSDLPTITSSNYTVVAGNSITTPTVAISDPSAATGARTRYVIGFSVSGTGGLSAEAGSQITVNLPGTTTPGWQSGTLRDITRNVDVGSCSEPDANQISTCGFFSNGFVNPGDQLQITLRGITNGTAGTKTASVTTTSDLPTITSSNYTVVAGNSITTPTVAISDPSAATGARTRYVIGFSVSGTGGLSAEAGSQITVNLPGTTTPGWQSGTLRDITRNVDVGSCSEPNANQISTCGFFSNGFVNPGDQLEITLRGITNGTAGTKTASVATTSDLPTITSGNYAVLAGNTLTGVAAQVGSMAPSAATNYVVLMKTSATGGLSAAAGSQIQLTLPAGTTFTGYSSGSVHDVDRAVNVGSCGTPTGLVISCGFFSNGFVNAGDTLRITFPRITNPASAGPYALTATTTSDTPAVSSGPYTHGIPTAPDTTIDSATVTGDTGQFVFSSSEGDSAFECRIDGGVFFACSSPYTTPSLPGGAHTFDVRAVGAGGPDLTPASRTFAIATPTPTPLPTVSPTPTPTATPTAVPTPVAQRTVVVETISGTIRICDSPGVNCRDLPAGQSIPVGATVDAKRGVVELTSVPKAGAPPQTARFRDGIFKVTQSAKTTDVTLNEPLAACPKKGRAAAAAKKAKTRKLWGDGKGAFRTSGKYSAATVRGTKWLVQDSCAGTLTKVTEGVVSVRDNVKRKTILLRAPKSYTAKPKR